MEKTPNAQPPKRPKSMEIFTQADPTVQKIIKECLTEERRVMNMLRRDDIYRKLIQIVQSNTKNSKTN